MACRSFRAIRANDSSPAVDYLMARLVKWAIGLVVLALATSGGYYVRVMREIPVRVAAPQENVEVRVFGIGTVEAQVLSKVGFQVGGKLVSIHADQGDFVATGAPLAKLDDQSQRAKLLKSEATRRQVAANVVKVRAQRDRAEAAYQQKKNVNLRRQTLVSRGTVSQEAAEDTQAAEAIAHSDLKVVEADAAIATVLEDDAAAQRKLDAVVLAQHELTAPFDARVIARHKEVGSIANAGEAVFTLIAPQSIWVRAYVDERWRGAWQSDRRHSFGYVRTLTGWSRPRSFVSTRRAIGSPRSAGCTSVAAYGKATAGTRGPTAGWAHPGYLGITYRRFDRRR